MKKYCFAIAAILTSVTLGAQSPAIEETTGSDLQTVENSATKAAETPAIEPVTPTAESPATRSFRPTISSYFEMRADAKLPKQDHLVNAHLANLYVNAQLTESLSFHWRVRFSKWYGGQSLINSSDFLYLKWQPFEHLRFKAGRECLYI